MKINKNTTNLITLILFIISILVSVVTYNKQKAIVETFAQCVYRPFGKRIDSIDVDMSLDTVTMNNINYEIPVGEFRLLIESIPFVSTTDFLMKVNASPSIMKYQNKSNPFKFIYNNKNEFVLYREPKVFGYHIRVDSNKNKKHVKVLGIITGYDIYSKYIQNLDKMYHDVREIIDADTISSMTKLHLDVNKKLQ